MTADPPSPFSPELDPAQQAADAAFRRYLDTGDPAAVADLFDRTALQLRRTAQHLVGDVHTADDLVQATFLAALQQRSFDRSRPVLPWLVGILRHQASLVHRRRARGFDPARLRPEAVGDPAVEAAEEELRASIEAALRRLPAVYQSVVRLHVLHGLEAREIQDALGRPGGTVRTQLVRGLQALRGLLPVGAAGVLAGLLPSTGLAAVRVEVLAVARRGGALAGGSLAVGLAAWLRAGLGLCLAAALAVVGLVLWSGTGDASLPAVPVAQLDPLAVEAPTGPMAEAPAAAERAPVVVPAAGSAVATATVSGLVRDPDGAPAVAAEVLVWLVDGPPVQTAAGFTPPPAVTTRTDGSGRFTLGVTGPKLYLLARGQGSLATHGVRGDLAGRTQLDGFELQLAPVVTQTGELRAASGLPVPGFRFGTHRGSQVSAQDKLAVVGFLRASLPFVEVESDQDGRFRCDLVASAEYLWEVQHPAHPMLRVRHAPNQGPLLLQLAAGATVRGLVFTPAGGPAAGVTVLANDWPVRRVVTDAAGRFELVGLALRDGLMVRIEAPDAAFSCTPVPADGSDLRIRLEPAAALAGVVVDAAGQPVADAELQVIGERTIFTGATYSEPSTWEYVCGGNRVRTDQAGAFHFARLYPGNFRVRLWRRGDLEAGDLATVMAGRQDLRLSTADLEARTARCRLQVLDALTGAPLPAVTVTVWRAGDRGTATGRTAQVALEGGYGELGGLATGPARLTFVAPGYAFHEVPERQLAAGDQPLLVALAPVRTLDLVLTCGGEPGVGSVAVLVDGVAQWLEPHPGTRMQQLECHDGRLRLDGLAAQVVTLRVTRHGLPPVEQVVDLRQPPAGPLVLDLPVPPRRAEFTVLVLHAATAAAAGRHAGAPDREWLSAVLQDRECGFLAAAATVRLLAQDGSELAHARIAPNGTAAVGPGGQVPRFRVAVQHADGQGSQSDDAALPAAAFRVPAGTIRLVVDVPGRAKFERTFDTADLVGEQPAVAAFVVR